MRYASTVLLFLLITRSQSLEANDLLRKNNLISNFLKGILEPLFQKLSNFSIPDLNLGKEVGSVSKIKGTLLEGLENKIDGIGSLGFRIHADVRKMLITGAYDFQNLKIPQLFPVFGNGDFSIYLGEVTLNLSVNIEKNNEKDEFELHITKLDILLKDSKVKFENLMNDSHLADFLNTLISNLIPDFVDMLNEPVLEMGQHLVKLYGNEVIKCILDNIFSKEEIKKCIQNLFTKAYEIINNELRKNTGGKTRSVRFGSFDETEYHTFLNTTLL